MFAPIADAGDDAVLSSAAPEIAAMPIPFVKPISPPANSMLAAADGGIRTVRIGVSVPTFIAPEVL